MGKNKSPVTKEQNTMKLLFLRNTENAKNVSEVEAGFKCESIVPGTSSREQLVNVVIKFTEGIGQVEVPVLNVDRNSESIGRKWKPEVSGVLENPETTFIQLVWPLSSFNQSVVEGENRVHEPRHVLQAT